MFSCERISNNLLSCAHESEFFWQYFMPLCDLMFSLVVVFKMMSLLVERGSVDAGNHAQAAGRA